MLPCPFVHVLIRASTKRKHKDEERTNSATKFARHKRGWSINALAEAHGLAPSTLRSALDKPYPKSERLIAEAIGVPAEFIWPERHASRNFKPVLHKS